MLGKSCHDMVEGSIILLDARLVLGEDCGTTAETEHQLSAHLVVKCDTVQQIQLVLGHLLGNVILVSKGGDSAEHLAG